MNKWPDLRRENDVPSQIMCNLRII